MNIETELKRIKEEAEEGLKRVRNLTDFFDLKSKYIGRKKSVLVEWRERLKKASSEEKKELGKAFNELKTFLENLFHKKEEELKSVKEKEKIDITLPPYLPAPGRLHPITLILNRILDIFTSMNFEIAEGPDVEDDFHNFEALNIPPHHPARDMQDTLYLEGNLLLRTHTSPVQIRVMEHRKPPIRIVAPGKVYRRDSDVSHTPMFHQVEGLVVDKGITFAHLKGTIEAFLKELFGKDIPIRFRPSYFPFTEPSAEVDIGCIICGGKGCRVCGEGWLEVMGCGMVHPNVFKAVKYPVEAQGYAFGMGVERLTMLIYRIDDIRLFFENDIRFLRQF